VASLFPSACPGCTRRVPVPPCRRCRSLLLPADSAPPPAALDTCRALLSYEGLGRELIARLKYRNHRAALGSIAVAMSSLLASSEIDVVTWAPTTASRRQRRGFDQAELFARAVARTLGRPLVSLLERAEAPPLTGHTRSERVELCTFAARRRCFGRRVLVVDDVLTTGATLTAAARALRLAGASEVHGLVAARTPAPSRAVSSLVPVSGGCAKPAVVRLREQAAVADRSDRSDRARACHPAGRAAAPRRLVPRRLLAGGSDR